MAGKKEADLEQLFRSLITKICKERKFPDFALEHQFVDGKRFTAEYTKLWDKLVERKNDLPSVEYLEKIYKFEALDDNYTMTDISEILKDKFVGMKLNVMFQDAKSKVLNGDRGIDIIKDFDSALRSTKNAVTETNVTSLLDDKNLIIKDYLDYKKNKDPIPTGFDIVDSDAPLRRGELVMLIGCTGAGKSMVVSKMACSNIEKKIPATLVSLEMGRLQVIRRMLPILTKGAIKSNEMRDAITKTFDIEQALDLITTHFNIITRKTAGLINVNTIEAHLEDATAKGNCPHVVYIDYFNLLDQDCSWNAEEGVGKNLKRLAIQYNVLMVLLAQADTETVKTGKFPDMMSVAKNKGITHDCDNVLSFLSTKNTDGSMIMDFRFIKRRDDDCFLNFSMKVRPNVGEWVDVTGNGVQL